MRFRLLGNQAGRIYLFHAGFFSFATTLIFTINMVWQAQGVGLNPLQLVLVGTVLELTCFFGEVPTGIVADVYSRRLSVIIGVFLYGVGFLLEGLVPTFESVLACQVLWGTGATFLSGAHQAWLADEVGEEHVGPLYVRAAQWEHLAGLAAVPVSVALASLQLNLPVILGALLFFVLGGFLVAAMPETRFRPTPSEQRSTWHHMAATFTSGLRAVRGRPVLVTILAIGAFYGAASEGIDRLTTPHFLDNFAFPTIGGFQPVVWFGAMGLGARFLSFGALEIVRRTVDTTAHRTATRVLFVLSVLQTVAVVAFGLAGDFVQAVAASWAIGVVRSTIEPIYGAWLNRGIDPRVRATVLSMAGQANAIGQIAGGPPIGAIATVVSLRAALVTAGLILSPALLLFGRASGQGEVHPEESAEAVAAPVRPAS